ncbi:ABC transporter [Cutibacterium acnes]|nr:ABC transporter [Cutibacterium acnes]
MLSWRRPSERRRALVYEDKQHEESNGCKRDPSGHVPRRNWVRQVRAFTWLKLSVRDFRIRW